ncbi:ectoine hydroxylase-related dioxygenase (phytanoyl-CoA dioxygenase family) [Crossiella equi]|uniref:Ectoine hydroxylase-related dioxygenase (Phytanoyl-CoA dioxygenase family) n=1 Tax=Crossiella equi TaxID=130796 RepID=A0ABS5A5R6_9PSEU|nr:phytanoyl-CoA dioxygenase family protein [Crossiella equi]MBP2471933.1 ectoine hydroxylase-related dioxygenase (phytanoyl-CoA dioxygenase family) [Crossiella equi]
MRPTLTEEQLASYQREGWLLLKDVVSQSARDRVAALFQRVVADYAGELLAAGELSRSYAELPFDKRWAAIRAEVPSARPVVWRRVLIDPAVHELWFEPGLLGAAQSLLGPEIRAYHLFNGRPREPNDPAQTIHWHQDAFNCEEWEEADSRILTFWVPLVPVDTTSGCLCVVPGSHHRGLLPQHTDEFGITGLAEETELDGLPVPMEPGDALLFNELVLHRSLDNTSDRVRWSIDIRYSADSEAHQRKAPGGFRVSSAHGAAETFEEWAAKWDPKTGVMRRQLRRLDLYARTLSERESRDLRTY